MQTLGQKLREEGARAEKQKAKEEKLNIAREFIRNGVDMHIVSRATGLSLEQLEKLVTTVQ